MEAIGEGDGTIGAIGDDGESRVEYMKRFCAIFFSITKNNCSIFPYVLTPNTKNNNI